MDASQTIAPTNEPGKVQDGEPGTFGTQIANNGTMEPDSPTADTAIRSAASDLMSTVQRSNNTANNDQPALSSRIYDDTTSSPEEVLPIDRMAVAEEDTAAEVVTVDNGLRSGSSSPRSLYHYCPEGEQPDEPSYAWCLISRVSQLSPDLRDSLISEGLLWFLDDPPSATTPRGMRDFSQYIVEDIPIIERGDDDNLHSYILRPLGPQRPPGTPDYYPDPLRTPGTRPSELPRRRRGLPQISAARRRWSNMERRFRFGLIRIKYELLRGALGIAWPSPIVVEQMRRDLCQILRNHAHGEVEMESESEADTGGR